MHRRRPAARHQNRIAGDSPPCAGDVQAHGLDAKTPVDAGDLRPGRDLDPGGARGLRQRSFRLAAQIGDQRDIDACSFQVERGAIGPVMRRRDDHALADLHAVLTAIASRGVGEHYARAVVIREHQRTLDRAGRQHHLARANLPQALARQVGIGDEVGFGDALVEGDEVLGVIAERLRARHQAQVGQLSKRSDRLRQPIARAHGLDSGLGLGEERAARDRVLVADDNPRAACARGQRRRQTRRSGADDQDVAMSESPLIAVGIGLARSDPETRGAADRRLIDTCPRPVLAEQVRTHERLVVEAGAEQRRQEIADRADVECKRRPAVLARSAEPVVELDLGRAQVGCEPAGPAGEADERVRLLRAGAEDPARPVILVRAPNQMNAVGEKRGGERIPGAAFVSDPIEREGEGPRAVDRTKAIDSKGLAHAHRPASSAARSGLASPAL